MTIAILCPTRKRPEGVKRMCESAWTPNVKIYLGCDRSEIIDFSLSKCEEPIHSDISWREFPDMLPTAQKWNELAITAMRSPDHKLFMLGSDDMYFDTPGWDRALIDHYENLENKIHVYHLQDSRDEKGTPHPIVTREYIEAMGFFVPPIFLHWFVDSWTVEIARSNSCFSHFPSFRLIHDKPSDLGNGDETHSRIRQWGWHERDKYVNDTCGHFLEAEKDRLRREMKFQRSERNKLK